MTSWTERVHEQASYINNQIASARLLQEQENVDVDGLIQFYLNKLDALYDEDYSIAKIFDTSDIVMHATGPAAHSDKPGLKAFNWLCGSAEKNIRLLSASIFDLSRHDARFFSKKLDLRFNGYAPGSIYAGFSLAEQEKFFDFDDEFISVKIKEHLKRFIQLPASITDEDVSEEAAELFPDPAYRDAAFEALLGLSPTGRNGIDKVDLSSRGVEPSYLSASTRLVIKHTLKSRNKTAKKSGVFTGSVRQIDLDAGRVHLREVKGIGTIRCVIDKASMKAARALLGREAIVKGVYDVDSDGKPRLMYVDHIAAVDTPSQAHINT